MTELQSKRNSPEADLRLCHGGLTSSSARETLYDSSGRDGALLEDAPPVLALDTHKEEASWTPDVVVADPKPPVTAAAPWCPEETDATATTASSASIPSHEMMGKDVSSPMTLPAPKTPVEPVPLAEPTGGSNGGGEEPPCVCGDSPLRRGVAVEGAPRQEEEEEESRVIPDATATGTTTTASSSTTATASESATSDGTQRHRCLSSDSAGSAAGKRRRRTGSMTSSDAMASSSSSSSSAALGCGPPLTAPRSPHQRPHYDLPTVILPPATPAPSSVTSLKVAAQRSQPPAGGGAVGLSIPILPILAMLNRVPPPAEPRPLPPNAAAWGRKTTSGAATAPHADSPGKSSVVVGVAVRSSQASSATPGTPEGLPVTATPLYFHMAAPYAASHRPPERLDVPCLPPPLVLPPLPSKMLQGSSAALFKSTTQSHCPPTFFRPSSSDNCKETHPLHPHTLSSSKLVSAKTLTPKLEARKRSTPHHQALSDALGDSDALETFFEDCSPLTQEDSNATAPRSFTVSECRRVLRTLHASSTTSSVATSLEGMYGENRISSLQFLCQTLQTYFFLNEDSVFLDIGSGRGLPSVVVAVMAAVRASVGVEIDETAYYLSLRTLTDLHTMLVQRRLKHGLDVIHNPGDCRVAFCHADAVSMDTLDPVTHVFSFDLAMPVFMIDRFIALFNASSTAVVFVTFRRDLSEFDIDAEPVCQLQMNMSVSSEQHRATIYVKRSHLHKLWQSIPRKDDMTGSTLTPSGSVVPLDLGILAESARRAGVSKCSICRGCLKVDPGLVEKHLAAKATEAKGVSGKHLLLRSGTAGPCRVKRRRVLAPKSSPETRATSPVAPAPVLLSDSSKFWACCDLCGRWRCLPGCTSEEFEELEAEPVWSCAQNRWDPAQASCTAPPSEPEESEVVVDTMRWAQCEECHKWRALPGCTALEYRAIQRKDAWTCCMNTWDPKRASCSVPEQSETEVACSAVTAPLSWDIDVKQDTSSSSGVPPLRSGDDPGIPSCDDDDDDDALGEDREDQPRQERLLSDGFSTTSTAVESTVTTDTSLELPQLTSSVTSDPGGILSAGEKASPFSSSQTATVTPVKPEHASMNTTDGGPEDLIFLPPLLLQRCPIDLLKPRPAAKVQSYPVAARPMSPLYRMASKKLAAFTSMVTSEGRHVIQRLVARCNLPLLTQVEWCHLEFSMWLASARRYDVAGSRRKRRYRTPSDAAQEFQKRQNHQDMEDKLAARWQAEHDVKVMMETSGKWCTCAAAERRRPLVVPFRVPCLSSGQQLVANVKSELECAGDTTRTRRASRTASSDLFPTGEKITVESEKDDVTTAEACADVVSKRKHDADNDDARRSGVSHTETPGRVAKTNNAPCKQEPSVPVRAEQPGDRLVSQASMPVSATSAAPLQDQNASSGEAATATTAQSCTQQPDPLHDASETTVSNDSFCPQTEQPTAERQERCRAECDDGPHETRDVISGTTMHQENGAMLSMHKESSLPALPPASHEVPRHDGTGDQDHHNDLFPDQACTLRHPTPECTSFTPCSPVETAHKGRKSSPTKGARETAAAAAESTLNQGVALSVEGRPAPGAPPPTKPVSLDDDTGGGSSSRCPTEVTSDRDHDAPADLSAHASSTASPPSPGPKPKKRALGPEERRQLLEDYNLALILSGENRWMRSSSEKKSLVEHTTPKSKRSAPAKRAAVKVVK